MTRRKGFTLVELLVVATIVVALVAMLAPALDHATRAAASTVCLANLRGWSMAMKQYSMDHKGAQMTITVSSPRADWWIALGPYTGYPYVKDRSVPLGAFKPLLCPDGPIRLNEGMETPGTTYVDSPAGGRTYVQGGSLFWGSATKAWQFGNPYSVSGACGSYGWNYWTADTPGGWPNGTPDHFGRFRNTPGDAVLLGDAIWIGSWPRDADSPPTATPDTGNAGTGWAAGGEMGRWAINRHPLTNMSLNIGFADGTARNVRIGELWALQWHKRMVRSYEHMEAYP